MVRGAWPPLAAPGAALECCLARGMERRWRAGHGTLGWQCPGPVLGVRLGAWATRALQPRGAAPTAVCCCTTCTAPQPSTKKNSPLPAAAGGAAARAGRPARGGRAAEAIPGCAGGAGGVSLFPCVWCVPLCSRRGAPRMPPSAKPCAAALACAEACLLPWVCRARRTGRRGRRQQTCTFRCR